MRQKTDLGPLIVDLIARKAVAIPPAPEVALRLQELVASRHFDVGHLARWRGGTVRSPSSAGSSGGAG
jgi:hypothetical protein